MHLANVKGGVREEQIKRGSGHAGRRVLEDPEANEDQAGDYGQVAQHCQRTGDDESGVNSLDFRRLLLN